MHVFTPQWLLPKMFQSFNTVKHSGTGFLYPPGQGHSKGTCRTKRCGFNVLMRLTGGNSRTASETKNKAVVEVSSTGFMKSRVMELWRKICMMHHNSHASPLQLIMAILESWFGKCTLHWKLKYKIHWCGTLVFLNGRSASQDHQ